MQKIPKMYTIDKPLILAVKDFVQNNPGYTYNDKPSESAFVREAIELLLEQKSKVLDQQPATPAA